VSRAERVGSGEGIGMSRHEVDVVSMVSGLLLVLLAGLFLLDELTSLSLDAQWVVPVVLLNVGVAGLVTSLRSRTD